MAGGQWRRCGDDGAGCTSRLEPSQSLQKVPASILYRNAFGPGLWVQMTYSSRLIYSHDQLHATTSSFHPLQNISSVNLPFSPAAYHSLTLKL